MRWGGNVSFGKPRDCATQSLILIRTSGFCCTGRDYRGTKVKDFPAVHGSCFCSAFCYMRADTQDFRGTETREHPHIGALVQTRVTEAAPRYFFLSFIDFFVLYIWFVVIFWDVSIILKKDNPKDLDPSLTGLQLGTVTGETSVVLECFPLFPLRILEGRRAFECYQLPKLIYLLFLSHHSSFISKLL